MQRAALPSDVVENLVGTDERGKAVKGHLRLNVEKPAAPAAPVADDNDDDDDDEDDDDDNEDNIGDGAEKGTAAVHVRPGSKGNTAAINGDAADPVSKPPLEAAAGSKPASAADAALAKTADELSTKEMMVRVRNIKPQYHNRVVQINRRPEIESARQQLPIIREEYQVSPRFWRCR